MAKMQSASGSRESKLPVFAFPPSITFYTDDQASHKQLITLYNPYDFMLQFKVLCTAPRKYNIVDAGGSVKAKCCVDIVIRHKDVCTINEGARDKLRIQTYEVGLKTISGKRDIPLLILSTKERASDETFETLPSSAASMQREGGVGSEAGWGGRQFPHIRAGGGGGSTAGVSKVVIVAAVACLLALMLPLDAEGGAHPSSSSSSSSSSSFSSRLPMWLYLSVNHKLVAAYILGLVTMAMLRS